MVFCKMLSLVAMCAAIWLTARFAVVTREWAALAAEPVPENASVSKRPFLTSETTPQPDPRFPR